MMVVMVMMVLVMLIKANVDLEKSSHSARDGGRHAELFRTECVALVTPPGATWNGVLSLAARRFTPPSRCPASVRWSVWTRVPSNYHTSCRW